MSSYWITASLTALMLVAGTGCALTEEEKQEVDLGQGVTVEIPADLEGKEGLIESIRVAFDDHLDLAPEIEDCVVGKLEETPPAEFDRILDLPESQQERAALDFSNQYTLDCVQSGDNLVETDANALTLRVLRHNYVAQVTLALEGERLSESELACITDQYESISDAKLIEISNSTFKEQQQFGLDAARNCF